MAEEKSGIKNSGLSAVVCAFTLLLICIMAFAIRLFSVVKYESVIHEFDPYFNLRVSQFLAKNGPYAMWNWFDDRTWYPLGRVIGGTVYPGLMLTAGTMWWILNSLHITIDIGTVCVFTSPIFSANCAWATFLLTKEVKGTGAGLTAAALIATVPSYISRSVAGSYDNEGIAIFALVFTFYLYVKTLNTGSLFWATANALAYFYMVCSWGGYTFIINLIPIHMLACLLAGKYSAHLYIAYAPFIIFGTLLAASVPVVGFNAVMTSEHFASVLVFAVLHVFALVAYLKRTLTPAALKAATAAILTIGAVGAAAFAFLLVGLVAASPTLGWSGRSLSLLDPTYAGKYIPIIASVSEHQPPTWPSYFMDLHVLILLVPAGIAACFMPLSVPSAFLILYGVVSVYFSGAMVRLMLVLAPAACILAGIGLSEGLHVFARSLKHGVANMKDEIAKGGEEDEDELADGASKEVVKSGSKEGARDAAVRAAKKKSVKKRGWEKPWWARSEGPIPFEMAAVGIALALLLMFFFVLHCVWASAEAYSAPSIVLASHNPDGSTHIFDDFREAYGWLRHNTDENTKVASWWDYGYQTTAMANRTVIVDNNTWNNTHIATVGMAMSSPEKEAWKIFKTLDVEYVFVIFGGFVGYSGDDIAKFLWMVRIGGGVYPHIKEPDYLKHGSYRIDSGASSTMLNCLMYKLSYYRFADATMAPDGSSGYDRVRRTEIGKKNIKLRYFEEVFTTHHWMVRIYRLKDVPNRQKGSRKKATKTIGSPKKNKLPKSASKRKSRIGGLRF